MVFPKDGPPTSREVLFLAVLKTILHKKNSSGSYDDVYVRTRADNVLLTDNSTLLSTKLSSMDTTIAGKAASSHSHAAGDITSGTLPASRGGTGVTSINALKTALGISSGGSGKLTYATYTATGTYTLSVTAKAVALFAMYTNTYNYSPDVITLVLPGETNRGMSGSSRSQRVGATLSANGTSLTIDHLVEDSEEREAYPNQTVIALIFY